MSDKKPSLALIIAQSKASHPKGAAGDDHVEPRQDDEETEEHDEDGSQAAACLRHFFEAGQDGDFEDAHKALKAYHKHAKAEPEDKVKGEDAETEADAEDADEE